MTVRNIGTVSLVRHLGSWRSGARSRPAYLQLADALRLLILDGRLPLGVRLPGERELARGLDLSRTTVTAAFAHLRDGGFVQSRQGSGVRTSLPSNATEGRGSAYAVEPQGAIIDLTGASLPASPAIHQAYTTALERLPAYLPSRGYDRVGLELLRTAIAEKYCRRGLPTTASQIVVTSGALHGLALLLRTVTSPGDRVVIDHPTFPHAIDAIQRAACRPLPVSLPGVGWDIEGMIAAFRQGAPRLAYIVPDFHNPTGRCMDSAIRGRLAEVAAETRTMLVFDETLGDLGIDMEAPVPDAIAEAGVVRLGSMGKSFWGGLRIGWIRAEPALISALVATRSSIDLGTPVLEQIAAAALLESQPGMAERRETLRERRDALVASMKRSLPGWTLELPPGGLSIWAELPEPVSTSIAATAERYGLSVAAGPRFGIDGAFERFMRLPFTQPVDILESAVDRLARAYDAVSPIATTVGRGASLLV